MKNIASYYGIKPDKLQRHYKHKVSEYKEWAQLPHANEYLIYPENITDKLSIDEVSLSKGELYTFVTNKNVGSQNQGSLVAIINGTEAKLIQQALDRLPLEKRKLVKEVTMDMARNMALAIHICFPNCKKVIDRFHAVKLVLDAMQHMRTTIRWSVIKKENNAIKKAKKNKKKYCSKVLSNGDTLKELLARSRYLLYIPKCDWTVNQTIRGNILFKKYPLLEKAYKLTMYFRNIYKKASKEDARIAFIEWKNDVIESKITEFNSAVNSLEYHLENILNYFDNRSTNANAESFNSKIKAFRANLRGVSDVNFFLFRLEKLFA